VAAIPAALVAQMANDPVIYRDHLRIESNGKPIVLGRSLDPWQNADFRALDGGWLRALGKPASGTIYSRAWLERPRGGSKTGDIAVSVGYALAFASRPVVGLAAAADQDQAKLLRDAIGRLVRLNPWLPLDVQLWKVVNERTGSELTIISSDVASSWGHLIDFAVLDEVPAWPEGRGEELFASLLSAVAKKENAVLICIGNAGWEETWQARLKQEVSSDPAWYASVQTEPASWIAQRHVAEQQRLLPVQVFARLWKSEWSSGSGDAISAADLAASVVLQSPPLGPEPQWSYFLGVDLAVSRDATSLVLIGKHASGRLRLIRQRTWLPPKDGRIQLSDVERVAWEWCRGFAPVQVCMDPYQAEMLAQRLKAKGAHVHLIPFVGSHLNEMASFLVEAFSSRLIELYRDEQLLRDLRRLRLKESPSGFRLVADRTALGHCDSATALSLALWGARKRPLGGVSQAPVGMLTEGFSTSRQFGSGLESPPPFISGRNRTGALGYGGEASYLNGQFAAFDSSGDSYSDAREWPRGWIRHED